MKKQAGTVCTESRILKRFLGISLFICAAVFGQIFMMLPVYIALPSAALYLFLQYRLWFK